MAEAMDNSPSRVKWGQDPGWRGLVGFISPPATSIDPTEFLRIAPDGFQVLQTMTHVPGFKLSVQAVAEAFKQLENCCLALKQAGVDVIAQSGTPFAFATHGFNSAKQVCANLEKVSQVPLVMMGLSVVNALHKMKYSSVAVACTYYSDEMAARYTKFLEEAGIKVQAMENWVSQGIFPSQEEVDRLSSPRHGHRRAPIGLVYKAARIVADHCPAADCIVISGGGVCTMDILQALEEDVGKRVISSQATQFWEIFVRLGVSPVIRERGSLLASLARRL